MKKKKEPRFFKRRRWYTPLLIKLGWVADYRRIPIFGVSGVGKSYFSFSLCQYLKTNHLGKPLGIDSRFLSGAIQAILARKKLPPSVGNRELKLHLEKIRMEEYGKVYEDMYRQDEGMTPCRVEEPGESEEGMIPCNILISTNDMSGTDFENAMMQMGEPHADVTRHPSVRRFLNVVADCDGAMVVLDLVRGREQLAKSDVIEMIRLAVADQVIAVVNGIQLAIENRKNGNSFFPLFLIFTKKDIYGLERDELHPIVEEVIEPIVSNMADDIKIRSHAVTNMGFIESDRFLQDDSVGISFMLADLAVSTQSL